MSIAESVRNKIEKKQAETATEEVVPRVSFKLGLLSWQFDELWDKMSLLVSIEPKFLAICMLIREPFARYCSTLKFISEVFNRLGRWVPDFGEQIESMRLDDEYKNSGGEVVNPHEAAKAAEEYYFNAYRRGWERRSRNIGSFEDPRFFFALDWSVVQLCPRTLLRFEVHLKLKGTMESKDTTLISKAFFYDYDGVSVCLLHGLCEIELCCDHLEQSHQATILGVRILRGSLPCGKIKVACNGKHPSGHVLLFDSRAEKMPVSEDGYLDLSRQVVSVKSGGRLEILMQAGDFSGRDFSGSVAFPNKFSNVSRKGFELGGCEVEITVAWSLLIESQYDIS
ncbi:hypothetical protein ZWY2020_015117 [Hordeum vulgare]|nr:hypothetical protein ZWY2020_015117 [Hordeum vulgare]